MQRYCVLEKDFIKKIDTYSWDIGDESELIDIYKVMIQKFFEPESIYEKYDLLCSGNYFGRANKTIKDKVLYSDFVGSDESEISLKMYRIDSDEPIDVKLKIPKKIDMSGMCLQRIRNENDIDYGNMNSVIKEIICSGFIYFYLDLCQSLYFSIKWILNTKESRVYLNPFEKEGTIEEQKFLDMWKKFQRKGSNYRNRNGDTQQTANRGRKKGTKVGENSERMLSDIVEKIPLDAEVEYHYEEGTKIPSVGTDTLRFFICNKEGIDVFSNVSDNGLEKCKREEILDILGKYKEYTGRENVENCYLLEECFHFNISNDILEFLGNILFLDGITSKEMETYLLEDIETFILELRKCKPIFLKIFMLNVLFKAVKSEDLSNISINDDNIQSKIILQNKRIMKYSITYLKELVDEINNYYSGFVKCLFYGLYQLEKKDINECLAELKYQILYTKQKLDIRKMGGYEIMEKDKDSVDKKRYDKLYLYIQRALLIKK